MLHRILAHLLSLPIIILTSCVEGEEEIWINEDASGHVVSHYEIPSIALRQLGDPEDIIRALELIDKKEDLIEITDLSFEVRSGRAIFHLEADFIDARELLFIAGRNKPIFAEVTGVDPDKLDSITGDIDFRFEGVTPAFERVVNPNEIFPSVVSKRPKMLGSAAFKYTIHLPSRVRETNAHSVSDDGKTVSWNFKLQDHFENPMAMSFRAELPIPWWSWLLLVLLILGVSGLIWRLKRRRSPL
ncbi:hypothetical protein N9062_00245 [Akkermansiaceae bacterium]|nr:hypothetical protein [Akkermansiaceae bacterium]MDA7892230.1 hypothetical protein [Akkermansiaceae bacterium]MDB4502139.1 hypothetical protein [Akkermansiaceae bacterium]MDB4509407.1 hypothetical protein [Akkermansiaceae bacterium]